MQIERLVVTLEGDVRQLRAALAQGNAALAGTEVAAGKAQARIGGIAKASSAASPSVNAFRGSLTSLVASTLKLPGPLANVTSLLGTLAFGSAATVAIVAGLAAIAVGYRLLTQDTREAAKAQEDALGRIRALGQASREGREGTLAQDIAAQRKELAALEPAYKLALANRAKLIAAYEGSTTKVDVSKIGTEAVAAYERAADDLKRAEEELLTIRVEANDAAAKKTEEYFARLREQSKKTAADSARDAKELAEAWDKSFKRLREAYYASSQAVMRGFEASTASGPRAPKLLPFGRTLTAQAPQGTGDFARGADRFADAVDSFRAGVGAAFKDLTHPDFSQVGASLVASAVGVVAGKLLGQIGTLFEGFDTAAIRLADAMEQNTRALRASGAFLKRRVEGLGEVVGANVPDIVAAVNQVLDRMAVGDFKPKSGMEIQQEIDRILKASGATLPPLATSFELQLEAIAKALGIDLGGLSEETLRAFLESLYTAGFGLDDLANTVSRVNEALSNVPEGFKATLDYLRFRAADAVGAVSGAPAALAFAGAGASVMGAASRGVTLPNATFHVYGVQNAKALLAEIEDAALGKASRGGAVTFQPAYLRR